MGENRLQTLFKDFEKRNDAIPEILKNILELMDYSKNAIAKMTDEDINEIERSTPSLLEDLDIALADHPNYLGRFASNPGKFRLLPGQKAIFKDLIAFCNKESFLNSQTSANKRKRVGNDIDSYEKGKLANNFMLFLYTINLFT